MQDLETNQRGIQMIIVRRKAANVNGHEYNTEEEARDIFGRLHHGMIGQAIPVLQTLSKTSRAVINMYNNEGQYYISLRSSTGDYEVLHSINSRLAAIEQYCLLVAGEV